MFCCDVIITFYDIRQHFLPQQCDGMAAKIRSSLSSSSSPFVIFILIILKILSPCEAISSLAKPAQQTWIALLLLGNLPKLEIIIFFTFITLSYIHFIYILLLSAPRQFKIISINICFILLASYYKFFCCCYNCVFGVLSEDKKRSQRVF